MQPDLRPFQDDVIDRLLAEARDGNRRILVVSPTGSGKSVMMAALIMYLVRASKRVLVLAHLEQLIQQLAERLEHWVDPDLVGFIAGGRPRQYDRPVQIGSVQTLARRQSVLEEYVFNAVLIDEAHIGAFARSTGPLFLPSFKGLVTGWTATPYRLQKGSSMRDRFAVLVPGPTPAELTEMGYLVPMRYWSRPGGIDPSRIHIVGGEFKSNELESISNTEAMRAFAVEEWQRLATDELYGVKAGRVTLAFCCTQKHAADQAAAFRDSGIAAEAVDANTPLELRRELYARHADPNDPLTVLTSVSVISIGYDSPAVTAILSLAATASEARWIQAIGRGSRTLRGKRDCRVIDCCGNTLRHGVLADQGDGWVLEPVEQAEPGDAPHKFCESCGALNHASAKVCCDCGAEFPRQEKAPQKAVSLTEIKAASKEDRRRLKFHRLCQQAFRKQYRPGWAEMRFAEQVGHRPPSHWRKGALFGDEPTMRQVGEYALQLGILSARHGAGFTWAMGPLADEFGDELLADHLDLASTWWQRGVDSLTATSRAS